MIRKKQILLITLLIFLFIIGIGLYKNIQVNGFLCNSSIKNKNIDNKLSSLAYMLGLKRNVDRDNAAIHAKSLDFNNELKKNSVVESKVERLVASTNDNLSSLACKSEGEIKTVANNIEAQVKDSTDKVESKINSAIDCSKSKVKELVTSANDNLSCLACKSEGEVKTVANNIEEQVKDSTDKVEPKINSAIDCSKSKVEMLVNSGKNSDSNSKVEHVIPVGPVVQSSDVPRGLVEDLKNLPAVIDNQEVDCCVSDEISREVSREKEVACRTLFLGKLYNHTLFEYEVTGCALQKRWITNISVYGNSVYDAFDSCGKVVPLSCLLFGSFKIEDIFLLSKLSGEGKIYLIDACILNPEYRNIKWDQYLAYIAPFRVNMVTCAQEKGANFGAIYRFGCNDDKRVIYGLGFNVPIISRSHIIDLNFIGVDQKKNGFTDAQLDFVVSDFNKQYLDIYDFFCREILGPKGLCFKERQNKLGVGDISFFALFDIARLFERIDGLQINLDFTVPTGGKYKGRNIWEVVLGNGGACQLGLSVDGLMKTCNNFFNPSVSMGGKFAFEFSSCRRVPKLKSSDVLPGQKLVDVQDLIVPVFKAYSVRPFCEYDTCVKDFADQAFRTKTKLGSIFYFSLGNYFYNLFKKSFKLNIFYDFLYKGKDRVKVCAKSGIFNTGLLEKCTDIKTHQISWNLGYLSDYGVEVNFGSKHIVAGKNYPKINEFFVSLIANF